MFRVRMREDQMAAEDEGAITEDRRVIGTSIHGIFDAPPFRRHFLNKVRKRKNLPPLSIGDVEDARQLRDRAYDRFANILKDNLDVAALAKLAGVEPERLRA
jgi:adenosylcobyric acid synthase